MQLFLTSSPTGDLDGAWRCRGFDTRNDFQWVLRSHWPENARCLMITAFPENLHASEEMTGFFRNAALESGLQVSRFDLWDSRTLPEEARPEDYDVIFLGGGHVPTQNAFLARLGLREKLRSFAGVIVGISAGTMNCADEVYAQPEEPGEATDPEYRRFLPGLGLTKINVLPHLQLVRHEVKENGLRLFEDITLPDSAGREFLAMPDGSWVLQSPESTVIHGEAWLVKDGQMSRVCENGHTLEYGEWNK